MITHQHPSAFNVYLRNGWKLVPIYNGTKGPNSPGWNSIENCINESSDIPEGYGAGLAHAYSGTCAIDIDDMLSASLLFAQRGLNLQDLLNANDAVQIISGRPGSAKLLYRTWMSLASKKLNLAGKTALEFRCATSNGLTVQCLLPPSRHPSGTTYQWGGKGRWQDLPMIPASLLDWWIELLSVQDPEPVSRPDTTQAAYDMGQLRQALSHIDPDCSRQPWLECLMALKYTDDPEAYAIAKDWSERGSKYPGDKEFATQWKSLKNTHPTPITPGTLLKHAKDAGYVPPPPNVEGLFANVEPADPDDVISTGYPVPDCRLDLMPSILRDYATEVATTKGSSPVISAIAGMIACSAVADARSRLTPKLGMSVPPVLWGLTIGDPSAKKSQGDEPMFEPLDLIAKEHVETYTTELLLWKYKEAQHLSAMKAYEAHAAQALNTIDDAPTVPVLPPAPVPLRFRVKDSTSQKLAYLAAERPYGIACIMDETSSWMRSLTSTLSGDNRSTWTAAYDAKSYHLDRVSTGSLFIETFAIPIYGNIQPDVLIKYFPGLVEDGLLQRFIPALVPDEQATTVGVGVPDYLSYAPQWEQTIRHAFNSTKGGKSYEFSQKAQERFALYEYWLENLKDEERLIQSDPHMRSAMGKLLGQTARIAFIWHLLESPEKSTIDAPLVDRVIEWSKSYLIPALRYFYSMGDKQDSLEKWVADHILTAPEPMLSVSEVTRSARRILERMKLSGWRASDMVQLTLDNLAASGWCMQLPLDQAQKSPRYAINPKLREIFAKRRQIVASIRQDRIEEVRKIIRESRGIEPKARFARGLDREAYKASA